MTARDSFGVPLSSRSPQDDKTLTPERAIVGFCPDCGQVLVVLNWFESWPLVECSCEATWATTDLARMVRFERGMREVSDDRA